MTVDQASAHELADIAGEVGADVLEGALRYPTDSGGWQLGDLDLGEYLDCYSDQQVVVIVAPMGDAPVTSYTCGVCGFVMNEVGECPRCRLTGEGTGDEDRGGEKADILDQVRELLDEPGQAQT